MCDPAFIDNPHPTYARLRTAGPVHGKPEHTALRRSLNKAFKPSMLQALRPRIERLAQELLNRVSHAGCMDFMRDFAHPFPALVIAEMLGVDRADQTSSPGFPVAISPGFGVLSSPRTGRFTCYRPDISRALD